MDFEESKDCSGSIFHMRLVLLNNRPLIPKTHSQDVSKHMALNTQNQLEGWNLKHKSEKTLVKWTIVDKNIHFTETNNVYIYVNIHCEYISHFVCTI